MSSDEARRKQTLWGGAGCGLLSLVLLAMTVLFGIISSDSSLDYDVAANLSSIGQFFGTIGVHGLLAAGVLIAMSRFVFKE